MSTELNFQELERQINALPEHPSMQLATIRRQAWGWALSMGGGGLALVLTKLLPHRPWVVALLLALLCVELAGLLLLMLSRGGARANFRPSQERREFAELLDFDYPHHEQLVDTLAQYPLEQLRRLAAFASHRSARLQAKLPLLLGGLDKLGALPLFAALVVQFKDLQWPPQVSWPQVVLFALLMLFYWQSMLQLGLRFRLELYQQLLEKAVQRHESNLEASSPTLPAAPSIALPA